MRVVVTGAAGNLGHRACRELTRAGHAVTGTDVEDRGNVAGYLTRADASRLVRAVLDADLPGYPPERILADFGDAWRLRDPGPLPATLIDIARITTETGWQPLEKRHSPSVRARGTARRSR